MNNIIQFNTFNIEKIIKYILMSLITILCLRYIPNNPLKINDIIIISLIISIVYAILDIISPAIKIYNNIK
jgi:uncharacterized BrkB/YihY/UPF0761 family membrane protein